MTADKWTLEAVNNRLKAGKIGVSVRQRGDRLSLRATLPPKPGSKRVVWSQQDISLGIYANTWGFQKAEAEAKLLGGRIASVRFDWGDYVEVEQPKGEVAEWVAKFEEDYFNRRGRSRTTETTWKSDYLPAWHLLNGELSAENLIKAIGQVPANSRKRKLVCEKLTALAKYAGLTIDLSPYIGNYGVGETSPRHIPSAGEIELARERLGDRADWQWAYGVLAAYGLRPHELFFCEISPKPPHLLKVLEGKTGARELYPYHPQWAEQWRLFEVRRPSVTGRTYKDYGNRVSKTFNRRELPFTAYCLRHAFCIRMSTEYHVPVAVAASWSGHEAGVYLKIYNRWISGSEKRRVFEESLKHKP
ncbi:integrase [Scytonema hofmannii PCC 7110]|uniref:Integrase n=1 Tax=Scytonema hofmannii PCC 7110 TaxID=128403 RepID=A0A139XBI8_9CYAN|nr:hypothetical protein [Scytonema hofmannii]KYC42013.1 integrase [Scytonema hofmannii PCC 7110]